MTGKWAGELPKAPQQNNTRLDLHCRSWCPMSIHCLYPIFWLTASICFSKWPVSDTCIYASLDFASTWVDLSIGSRPTKRAMPNNGSDNILEWMQTRTKSQLMLCFLKHFSERYSHSLISATEWLVCSITSLKMRQRHIFNDVWFAMTGNIQSVCSIHIQSMEKAWNWFGKLTFFHDF